MSITFEDDDLVQPGQGVIEMSFTPAEIEEINASFKAAEVERAFWHAHHDEFLKTYPDQFVAVLDGEVIATSPDLLKLDRLLKRKGVKMGSVWLKFMETNPRRYIL